MKYLIARVAALPVVTFHLIVVLLRHAKILARAQNILFYPEGGFGHTIMAPDWLRRLHPEQRNLVIFSTTKGRHNPLVAQLWRDNRVEFLWLRTDLDLGSFTIPPNAMATVRILSLATRILRICFPSKTFYFWHNELISNTPIPDWIDTSHPFFQRYERAYYPLWHHVKVDPVRMAPAMKSPVDIKLSQNGGLKYRKTAALYIRTKGSKETHDVTSVNRASCDLESLLPSIEILNEAGYQVLLTGDATIKPDVKTRFPMGLVDHLTLGIDRDLYQLYAGIEADIHIGSLSGGSTFLFVTDRPGLMLNAFPPGDAYPNSTLHYKWVLKPDGTPMDISMQIGGFFYDHHTHGCHILDNSPAEMALAVSDFIAHCHNERPYGLDPEDMGISAPWIKAANGRLSPLWANAATQNRIALLSS